MTLLVLELDAGLAMHVSSALGLHARRLRADGLELPAELQNLAATCWRIARGDPSRPEATSLADLIDTLQSPPVTLLHTIAESAAALNVSQRQVERLVKSGALPSVVIGRARRIRDADLREYVNGLGGSSFRNKISTKTSSARRPPSAAVGMGKSGGSARTRPTSPTRSSGDVA
jgi:excisionase family DNA binding protein